MTSRSNSRTAGELTWRTQNPPKISTRGAYSAPPDSIAGLEGLTARRNLLSEPACTIILLYLECVLVCHTVSQCFKCFNVLFFCDFFCCSACAFDMCLLNYLLTYLLYPQEPNRRLSPSGFEVRPFGPRLAPAMLISFRRH